MHVVVEGRLVHYLDLNPAEKQVMLILHGWGHDSTMWSHFAQTHLARYRVIIPDLPAFGQSQPLPDGASVPQYSAWVANLCTKLKLDQISLLGHSTGGQIAAYTAAKNLIPITKMVLVGPALKRFDEKAVPLSIMLLKLLSKLKPYLPKLIVNSISTSTDYGSATVAQRQVLNRIIRFNLEPYLSQVDVSTLSVWGEKDKETLGLPKALAHAMPNGKLRIIYDAGHNLHLESSHKLGRVINHFLSI